MDFDSVITFLLLLLFFVFPSILKRFAQKKKASVPTQVEKTKKLSLFEKLGDDSVLYLNPLLSGIDPAMSWTMLRLFEKKVLPYLCRSQNM